MMRDLQSAERVSHIDQSDNYVFQRSILAYHKAAEIVSGDVLEIGTGSGYGVEIIAPKVKSFITIDKYDTHIDMSKYDNVEFHKITVPPIKGIVAASIDYVVCFQVIEHINKDFELLREINRILRPGGRLIITTPNAKTSLTRNPWHVREYTADEFKNLLRSIFFKVEPNGVFGNEKIMEYYHKNRESVRSITRFDVLNMQYWLPCWLLRIPYDILNRVNRRRLLVANRSLTTDIRMEDYYIEEVDDTCFDLFYIATK